MATNASFIVGIDLGTTNCALAFAPVADGREAVIRDFSIRQLQRPGQVGEQTLLPSFLYSAGEHELAETAAALPWGEPDRWLVGEAARWQGSRVPGRLVASAKSWLCHPGVDRTAPILPWGAPAEVAKISPTEATARLLSHLVQAWNHHQPAAPLADQEVVITVPASFDEVARALTVNAARQAGLEHFTLLEEPQAAFYDFTSRRRDDLAAALRDIRLVLVVDVGGGTSDFSLIHTAVGDEGPVLKRIAVGEHLILGGDNMDAALARRVEERMTAGGRRLSAMQWTQLVQVARAAKEALLSVEGVEHYGVSIAAEGSRLLGNTWSAEVQRAEVEELILDGFFPRVAPHERPRRAARSALQELGLPYAQEAGITRHLAAFLGEHAAAGWAALGETPAEPNRLPRPDAILLNGGVFNSAVMATRLIDAVSAWWPEAAPVPLLRHESLDLAVARGAAYYGLVRRGLGRRIGGGAAHAFYVGVAGEASGAQAVCVVPRGQEDGQVVDLKERPFSLRLGEPVQFPLYSTTADRVDRAGAVVECDDSFRALPPIHSVLRGAAGAGGVVPVHLRASLTELGTLELWCVAGATDERWRLEFDLRGAARRGGETVVQSMPARYDEVRVIAERIYGRAPQSVDPKDVRQLRNALEAAIGPRELWTLPLVRELWGTLFAGANKRRRSVEHERVFYQLLGYCLRPGFGYPLDEWRVEQTFRLFREGVNARADTTVWREFWILWRRVAPGLSESQQTEMWGFLRPHLARQVPPKARNAAKPKGPQPLGGDEMVRTAASLELLPVAEKSQFGRWIIDRLRDPQLRNGPWAWALGRIGARVPIASSGHRAVPPEQVAAWLTDLLEMGLGRVEGGPFAAMQLARRTGDRARDLPDDLRERTLAALTQVEAPGRWRDLVAEVTQLESADEARVLGDSLPIGLKL